MKKILWLASWYPSQTDAYTGDFIERHARAAMLFNDIHVLHVVKNSPLRNSSLPREEKKVYAEGGDATIFYYCVTSFSAWIEKLISNIIYLKIHRKFLKKYLKEKGRPDMIHVHIGLKSGMAALYFKYFFGIPYVVSEQWSGFCPDAKPHFNGQSALVRRIWKIVMKNASGCTAVSDYLASAMKGHFNRKTIPVIPNVVDGSLFFPSGKHYDPRRFIHISTLNYQKNINQILESAAIVKDKLYGFKLMIFGKPEQQVIEMVKKLNLENVVEFGGLVSQEVLKKEIQSSAALILYSRYETFGCVIIEANACGKPVIVSDIPVFHENVREGINGNFVPLNNSGKLAQTILDLSANISRFNPEEIAEWAVTNFSFRKIGREFDLFYDFVLSGNPKS